MSAESKHKSHLRACLPTHPRHPSFASSELSPHRPSRRSNNEVHLARSPLHSYLSHLYYKCHFALLLSRVFFLFVYLFSLSYPCTSLLVAPPPSHLYHRTENVSVSAILFPPRPCYSSTSTPPSLYALSCHLISPNGVLVSTMLPVGGRLIPRKDTRISFGGKTTPPRLRFETLILNPFLSICGHQSTHPYATRLVDVVFCS